MTDDEDKQKAIVASAEERLATIEQEKYSFEEAQRQHDDDTSVPPSSASWQPTWNSRSTSTCAHLTSALLP
eukprot:COSAG06_NODE_42580_length_380_cov_0.921708_1_plen_70_part_01